ncbi:helix-turn-helix domain-containing protein [Nonomuraea sp. NPDC048892]|uniref:helix-turn-helix domain-containing protein n=1 Tax=Nonomuraea sp. NPDC048892 TaxID=3154624 RepID=UPI0033C4A2F7
MTEQLLTVNELADYLKKPTSWVYDNAREIPHMRVGREYRFRLSEVNLWLEVTRGGVPLKYLR